MPKLFSRIFCCLFPTFVKNWHIGNLPVMAGDTLFVNTKGKVQNTFDAIVIGSGISGGWAAKELCEQGIRTLVLERGRQVEHIKDYPTATKHPWEFPHRGRISR